MCYHVNGRNDITRPNAKNRKADSKGGGVRVRDNRGRGIRDYFADALGRPLDLSKGEEVTPNGIRKAFFTFQPDEAQAFLVASVVPLAEKLGLHFEFQGKNA